MIICRHTTDMNFAKTAKSKSECANYKNGNCGLDGELCHVDTYIIQTPAFSEVVSVSEPTDEQILFAIRQCTKLGLGEGIYEAEEEIVRCINERDKNILRVVKKVFEVLKEAQR